jgi:hypothetical protein
LRKEARPLGEQDKVERVKRLGKSSEEEQVNLASMLYPTRDEDRGMTHMDTGRAGGGRWRAVTEPRRRGHVGARKLTGTHIMGHRGPLASGPYQFKLFL